MGRGLVQRHTTALKPQWSLLACVWLGPGRDLPNPHPLRLPEQGLTWASSGRTVEVASWGLVRGPESRSSGEEGWGQAAPGAPHPDALLSGVPGAGVQVR